MQADRPRLFYLLNTMRIQRSCAADVNDQVSSLLPAIPHALTLFPGSVSLDNVTAPAVYVLMDSSVCTSLI